MEHVKQELADAVRAIQPEGAFAVGGKADNFPISGVSVAGVGRLGFPVPPVQAEQLQAASEQAPCGKGLETVVDTSIRNCRKIDADKVLLSQAWVSAVSALASRAAKQLSVKGDVTAHLYNLVLYPTGAFFLPHTDTEKADRMFATLVVQLPTVFSGAQLHVSHAEREVTFDFADVGADAFFYTAFFTDCVHEIKPVVEGFRVCLVYNLVRDAHAIVPALGCVDAVVEKIAGAATSWLQVLDSTSESDGAVASNQVGIDDGESDFFYRPPGTMYDFFETSSRPWRAARRTARDNSPQKLFIRLEHKYTEANVSFSALKGRDAALLDTLRRADKFDFALALIERHVVSAPKQDEEGYGRPLKRRREGSVCSDEESGSRFEIDYIIDSDTTTKLWMNSFEQEDDALHDNGRRRKGTALELDFENEFVGEGKMWNSRPEKEEYEEYTGNTGPSVEQWYRSAVLVFWPQGKTFELVCMDDVEAAVAHVARLVRNGSAEAAKRLRDTLDAVKRNPWGTQKIGKGLIRCANGLRIVALALETFKVLNKAELVETARCDVSCFVEAWATFQHEELRSIVAGTLKGLCNALWMHSVGLVSQLDEMGESSSQEKVQAAKELTLIVAQHVSSNINVSDVCRCLHLLSVARRVEKGVMERMQAELERLGGMGLASVSETLCRMEANHPWTRLAVRLFITKVLPVKGNEFDSQILSVWSWAQEIDRDGEVHQFLQSLTDAVCCKPSVMLQLVRSRDAWGKDKYMRGVVLKRVEQLEAISAPVLTWNIRKMGFVMHPGARAFLEGPNRTARLNADGCWTGVPQARKFALDLERAYPVQAVAGGRGKDSFIDIVKTEGVHRKAKEAYTRKVHEAESLRSWLKRSRLSHELDVHIENREEFSLAF